MTNKFVFYVIQSNLGKKKSYFGEYLNLIILKSKFECAMKYCIVCLSSDLQNKIIPELDLSNQILFDLESINGI